MPFLQNACYCLLLIQVLSAANILRSKFASEKILPSALDWLAAADNGAVTDDVKSVVKTIKVEDDVVELFDEDVELFFVVKELFDDDVNVVGAGVVGRDSPQEYTAEEFPQVRVRVAVLSNAEKSETCR